MEEAVRLNAVPLDGRLAWAEDAELAAACTAGDDEAFRELLTRYRKSALTLAYQMLGDAEEAEDVAQEAFARVFQAISRFRGQAAFSTWLYRIVTNLCLGRIRRRRALLGLESFREPSASDNPSRQVTESLLTRQVLSLMSADVRAILLLREQVGLSYREIAEALGLPLGTVRSRLSKARATFRRFWAQLLEGEKAART